MRSVPAAAHTTYWMSRSCPVVRQSTVQPASIGQPAALSSTRPLQSLSSPSQLTSCASKPGTSAGPSRSGCGTRPRSAGRCTSPARPPGRWSRPRGAAGGRARRHGRSGWRARAATAGCTGSPRTGACRARPAWSQPVAPVGLPRLRRQDGLLHDVPEEPHAAHEPVLGKRLGLSEGGPTTATGRPGGDHRLPGRRVMP